MSASPWLEIDSRFIPAHWQPVALLELLDMRGADCERVLRGTGIFREDVAAGHLLITPGQYDRLLANAARQRPEPEISFLYGERLFPGHFGDVTLLLLNAPNLFEAIDALCRYASCLTPLLRPRLQLDGRLCELRWDFPFGPCGSERFVLDSVLGGWLSFCRWLAPAPLPWRVEFEGSPARELAHYQTHLGAEVAFNRFANRLVIPVEYLYQPWPRASRTAYQLAGKRCAGTLAPGEGFVFAVADAIRHELSASPALSDVAAAFDTSPATLKRKLRKHNTSFQEVLDQVRRQLAIHLLTRCGKTSQEVARHLHFHDIRSFRRAFKRWTGLTPAALKAASA